MKRRTVDLSQPAARLIALDCLRACAIAMMIVYHFCFDLVFFHKLNADFNHDAFWLVSRAVIVTSFVSLVGVSLALSASHAGFRRRFVRRELQLALCALAVSAGSYAVFPQTFIFFGILHFIFVASLIGAGLLRLHLPPLLFAIAGVLALVAGTQWSSPLFDMPVLQWVGFMTHKPATEDYVPLFPWLGVVFLGIAAGKLAPWHPAAGAPSRPQLALVRMAAWLGRHSLAVYMVHQPVMLGLLYLLA